MKGRGAAGKGKRDVHCTSIILEFWLFSLEKKHDLLHV